MEMSERTDRQCPSVEQVPNESFWADQPGSHNLPPDVETEHWRLVANALVFERFCARAH